MDCYDLPDGRISVATCDDDRSVGTLALDGATALDPHTRPVDERLLQLEGTGAVRLYEEASDADDADPDEWTREVQLTPGETVTVDADVVHAHVAPESRSVTLWRFDGDIRGVIADIRAEYEAMG